MKTKIMVIAELVEYLTREDVTVDEKAKEIKSVRNDGYITEDEAIELAVEYCTLYRGYGLPPSYAEIEYSDMDSIEAYEGSRFDDMNYTFYMER